MGPWEGRKHYQGSNLRPSAWGGDVRKRKPGGANRFSCIQCFATWRETKNEGGSHLEARTKFSRVGSLETEQENFRGGNMKTTKRNCRKKEVLEGKRTGRVDVSLRKGLGCRGRGERTCNRAGGGDQVEWGKKSKEHRKKHTMKHGKEKIEKKTDQGKPEPRNGGKRKCALY